MEFYQEQIIVFRHPEIIQQFLVEKTTNQQLRMVLLSAMIVCKNILVQLQQDINLKQKAIIEKLLRQVAMAITEIGNMK